MEQQIINNRFALSHNGFSNDFVWNTIQWSFKTVIPEKLKQKIYAFFRVRRDTLQNEYNLS